MKTTTKAVLSFAIMAILSFSVQGQIKIKKPKIKTPKVSLGSGNTVAIPSKDPSGLFSNCTDDASAKSHRRNAVENLEKLEAEYKKESVDYKALQKLMSSNERTLGFILKLEPKVKADKYNERYLPLKERANKELAIYEKAQVLEKLFHEEYITPYKYKNYNPLTFRTDSYGAKNECFCRVYDHEKTLIDFNTSKKQYEDLSAQQVGYSHENTQEIFSNMTDCLIKGNEYAIWASKDNVQKEIVDFSTKERPLNPERVIKKCDNYLEAFVRIESDNSLNLSTDAKTAIVEGKATVESTKKEAEVYISSGAFEAHKEKLHQDRIAKEFLPKSVGTNGSIQAGAMKYVKGEEMKNYLTNRLSRKAVSSTLKAHMATTKPYIKKNDYDLPKYKYHKVWVAFKDTEGKCFKVMVYATYQYMGGGTYESTPTYSADKPIEMACSNVNK